MNEGLPKIIVIFITQPLSTFDIRKFISLNVSEKAFHFSRYKHDEKRENDKYLHLSSTVEDEAFQSAWKLCYQCTLSSAQTVVPLTGIRVMDELSQHVIPHFVTSVYLQKTKKCNDVW